VTVEAVARQCLAGVIESGTAAPDLDPELDMAVAYGLTSLNKVLFLMSACDAARVDLSSFNEADVAAMRTLGDVIAALARHAGTE